MLPASTLLIESLSAAFLTALGSSVAAGGVGLITWLTTGTGDNDTWGTPGGSPGGKAGGCSCAGGRTGPRRFSGQRRGGPTGGTGVRLGCGPTGGGNGWLGSAPGS